MRLCSISIALVLAASAFGQRKIRTDGQLAEESLTVWGNVKTALEAKGGDVFFESHLKNSLFPGGANGVHVFRGTVVAGRPAEHPSELVLAISDTVHPEATLRLVDRHGKPGHFSGRVTPGSMVAFIGMVTGFQKEPFMLTFDVQGEDGSGPTYALVFVAGADKGADHVPMASLQVNYRARQNTGFVAIGLDDFPLYTFTVNDHGASTEMNGVRLENFLVTAGWYPQPSIGPRHYAVEIDGMQPAVTLELVGIGSFDKQAWVVPAGKSNSTPEAALVLVDGDGNLIQRAEGIQRIRVSEK